MEQRRVVRVEVKIVTETDGQESENIVSFKDDDGCINMTVDHTRLFNTEPDPRDPNRTLRKPNGHQEFSLTLRQVPPPGKKPT